MHRLRVISQRDIIATPPYREVRGCCAHEEGSWSTGPAVNGEPANLRVQRSCATMRP